MLVTIGNCLDLLDIIVLTESNINYSLLSFYNIKGYNLNSYVRTGRSGGGVLVYTRAELCACVCDLATPANCARAAEYVSITLDYNNEQIHLLSIYRPPKINKQDKIKQFLIELRSILETLPPNKKVIICGDININLLNSSDQYVNSYENLLSEYGFTKCINDVTRKEILLGKIVQSCLDHIYIRANNISINSAVIKYKISDHFFVSAVVEWKQTPTPRARDSRAHAPSKRVLDNKIVKQKLENVDFDSLLSIECPCELYSKFCGIFTDIYNESYKIVCTKNSERNNKPWIDNNLKAMIEEKDRLFNVWCNEPKNMLKRLNYTRYRNRCQKAINKSKNIYDTNSIIDCKNNIKKLWEKINSLIGNTKPSLDSLIISNMDSSISISEVCNKFAITFTEEIEKIKHQCNETWINRKEYVALTDRSMRWQPVTASDINNVIKTMSTNKSPGTDLVRMSDIKIISKKLCPILAKLVNLSVATGTFPNKLKEAIVRPIHKKGNFKDVSNYRPIAILSSVDKIMEKCVVNQLGKYLQQNNIVNKCQHGFLKGKSTSTLLSEFTDEINNYLEDKKIVISIFFDYKKAFDTLQKDTLINAMKECGVGQPLNQWFSDYLTGRSYRVKVGDTLSDRVAVRSGVPQGSGCGPICYLMHVNSLCGVLRHCSSYMYADDLCVLRAGTDINDICPLIQQDIDAVVKWSHDNGIILNADKTKLLVIRSPYSHLSISTPKLITHEYSCFHNHLINCNCKPVEAVNSVTYLGVKIDESFSWSCHVDYICSKLRILLSKFYHLSYKVPIKILRCLYLSLVESIISYALDSYGLTFKTYINKLESLQIRFLKLLVTKKTKISCKDDYRKLFKICKILPVHLKHTYLLAINQHGRKEHDLSIVTNNHSTRSVAAGKFNVPRVNNYFGDRTLKKRIPYVLNSLPADIRQENNKRIFKSKLKKYLFKILI